MTLSETLKLPRKNEKEIGLLLENALFLKRHRKKSNVNIMRSADAHYLPAVNSRARVKWGTIFIEEIFRLFDIANDQHGPHDPAFLVTIADKSHLTTDYQQKIQLSRIRRKIGAGLKGLSYIGMIEPGYYNGIYDELGTKRKNVVSWHGHFLVRGATEKQLAKHLKAIRPNFTPIIPGLCAVHTKRIPRDQFGYKLWYILKSPRKEYSIGQRRECDKKNWSGQVQAKFPKTPSWQSGKVVSSNA
jgi:hypothetical protein